MKSSKEKIADVREHLQKVSYIRLGMSTHSIIAVLKFLGMEVKDTGAYFSDFERRCDAIIRDGITIRDHKGHTVIARVGDVIIKDGEKNHIVIDNATFKRLYKGRDHEEEG